MLIPQNIKQGYVENIANISQILPLDDAFLIESYLPPAPSVGTRPQFFSLPLCAADCRLP